MDSFCSSSVGNLEAYEETRMDMENEDIQNIKPNEIELELPDLKTESNLPELKENLTFPKITQKNRKKNTSKNLNEDLKSRNFIEEFVKELRKEHETSIYNIGQTDSTNNFQKEQKKIESIQADNVSPSNEETKMEVDSIQNENFENNNEFIIKTENAEKNEVSSSGPSTVKDMIMTIMIQNENVKEADELNQKPDIKEAFAPGLFNVNNDVMKRAIKEKTREDGDEMKMAIKRENIEDELIVKKEISVKEISSVEPVSLKLEAIEEEHSYCFDDKDTDARVGKHNPNNVFDVTMAEKPMREHNTRSAKEIKNQKKVLKKCYI